MPRVYRYILVMAVVTYLIRMLPVTLLRREIKSSFLRSFLFYVPYACLAAMTFPAILLATQSVVSAAAGFAVAVAVSLKGGSLLRVAGCACVAVFVVERVLAWL